MGSTKGDGKIFDSELPSMIRWSLNTKTRRCAITLQVESLHGIDRRLPVALFCSFATAGSTGSRVSTGGIFHR